MYQSNFIFINVNIIFTSPPNIIHFKPHIIHNYLFNYALTKIL